MKKYILPLVAALLMTGCEDYLDIKPYDRTIPKSTEDFSALVHDLCYQIDIGGLNYVVGSFQESMNFEEISDNMEANLGADNDHMAKYAGALIDGAQGRYRSLYETVRNCNIILGEYQEDRDSRDGQDIVGTAYAIRGVCYYQLLREFAFHSAVSTYLTVITRRLAVAFLSEE